MKILHYQLPNFLTQLVGCLSIERAKVTIARLIYFQKNIQKHLTQ
jgi:hypothetical protein